MKPRQESLRLALKEVKLKPSPMIETIAANEKTLALIIRNPGSIDRTTFPTPHEANLQVGFVVYPMGGEVARHLHLPLERHIAGTTEVLIVRKGRCIADIYDAYKRLVATRELSEGDVILLMAGGHGFRMLEDTVLLEIKQGPYTGVTEKERF